jgi:hypothetical protein
MYSIAPELTSITKVHKITIYQFDPYVNLDNLLMAFLTFCEKINEVKE